MIDLLCYLTSEPGFVNKQKKLQENQNIFTFEFCKNPVLLYLNPNIFYSYLLSLVQMLNRVKRKLLFSFSTTKTNFWPSRSMLLRGRQLSRPEKIFFCRRTGEQQRVQGTCAVAAEDNQGSILTFTAHSSIMDVI